MTNLVSGPNKTSVRLFLAAAAAFLSCAAVISGCSEDAYIGPMKSNKPPRVRVTNGPVEGDTTTYYIHFYWLGYDPDGSVDHYEFVMAEGEPYGFDPADTTGPDKWRKTNQTDSIFKVPADEFMMNIEEDYYEYSIYDKSYTFFIRAVDGKGMKSKADYRSFTAKTIAPRINIDTPRYTEGVKSLSRVIKFEWHGYDSDNPGLFKEPDSVRYMLFLLEDPAFPIVSDMNEHPENYEDKWKKWIYYRAEGDSGRSTTIGDDEILKIRKNYIFAVQAKDEAGAVTGIFDRRSNVRQFIVSLTSGPWLTVLEPFLGGFQFLGKISATEKRDLPPGIPLNFSWRADASVYGGEMEGYRYGWDVGNVNEPSDWEVDWGPFHIAAPERTLYSGVHTFFIEAKDNAGTVTRGQIEVNIVPYAMERNLLWVDDFYSTDFPQVLYATPTETEHDDFWLDICSRAEGFDPRTDVYDAAEHNLRPPPIDLIAKYKNIIWTFSTTENAWAGVITYIPESRITTGKKLNVNYLSLFLAKGGHLLTLGRSDRGGGLKEVLGKEVVALPMNLKCEFTGNATWCGPDTSGVNSMPYKDYCITILDKISGLFRNDMHMEYERYLSNDVMTYAYKDISDPVAARYKDLPERLDLWSVVTEPGHFFNPNDPRFPGGFTYAEIYDPEYWKEHTMKRSQSCFHPLYRMRARQAFFSPVDRTAIALVLTKYSNILPDCHSGIEVAANSFHFGFPLWFFERDQVDRIMNVIFREWRILDKDYNP